MSFNNTYLNTPPWLDKGDNAWQLTAATLVGLQSIPGLVILYGGIVKRKWAINSAFMAFYAFAMVLLCWVMWGYKMAFGRPWGKAPFIGEPGPVLIMKELLDQAILPTSGLAANFPLSTMVYFQFVFAAITLVITAGAFLGRMNFLAWMVYVPLWLTFSYTVGAYSLWGGGFLAVRGVIDYSGGYVIHLSSGTAGFVGAYWIGPRLAADREDFKPHNVLLTMVGAGILWLGWNGFNGGDPYNAGTDAGVAVLNTNVTTAASLLTWTFLDMWYYKRPSIIGSVQGMITGLVAITPCAGVIDGWAAILLGALSGSIPWATMNIAGKKLSLFVVHVDDTLGVFHTHMVAGLVGGLFVGVFACIRGSVAFGLTTTGAIDGNWKQIYIQLYGALFIIALNIVMTSIIMNFIKHVLRIPLRMNDDYLLIGDEAIHGENAYAMQDERILYGNNSRRHSQHDVEQGRAGTVLHRGGSGDIDSNEDKAPK